MSEAPAPPTASDQPQRSRPSLGAQIRAAPVTFSLIAFTSLVFLVQMLAAEIYGGSPLLNWGAKDHRFMQLGQYWRYVTPIVLHVDPLHLLVNMYSLYIIGPPVERPYGSMRFALIYLLTGVGGVAFSLAFSTQPSAGASGAIFGLLGALAAFLYMHRDLTGSAGRGQLRHILLVAVLNLAIGLSPGIDNWGHFGGLLCGAGLAFLLGPQLDIVRHELAPPRLADRRQRSTVLVRGLLATLAVALLAWAALGSPFRG